MTTIEINSRDFMTAALRVHPAADLARTPSIPVLAQVIFTLTGQEKLTALATDRYRVHMDSAEVHQVTELEESERSFLLPAKVIADLKRMGLTRVDGIVTISWQGREVTVACEEISLTATFQALTDVQAYPKIAQMMTPVVEEASPMEIKAVIPPMINTHFLADLHKAAKARPGVLPAMILYPCKSNRQVLAHLAETEFFAFIMGMRRADQELPQITGAAESVREVEKILSAVG